LAGESAWTVGLAMFVRLRRRGRGLHENFLGWGLLGGVARSFLRGEGDHIVSSDAAAGVRWAAVLGLHNFRPANLELLATGLFEGCPHARFKTHESSTRSHGSQTASNWRDV